jgi:archaellum biogenesis protein FlaJ (TadC family)
MSSRYLAAVAVRLDRTLYALFSRHADQPRHERDRDRYRGAALAAGFETFLARVYGLSWLVGIGTGGGVLAFGFAFAPTFPGAFERFVSAAVPGNVSLLPLSDASLLAVGALIVGGSMKRSTIASCMLYLRWRANARRVAIDRSLPGAVRYLRVLAEGSENTETMLRKVAEQDAYGETGEAFERVLETAALTGSLDTGLRTVARDTPSRELLAPFLLKFREHANQGTDSLREFLRMESRMLSHRQSRARQRAGSYLKLIAELFVVLLVAPALFVTTVILLGVLLTDLSKPVSVSGTPTVQSVLVYGSVAFVLVVGACTALIVARLRPGSRDRRYERPPGYATVLTALTNPASAAFVFAFPAVLVGWGLWTVGEPAANVVLLGYTAYGLPVGTVAVNRARIDDAKDREIRDFVHAVAGHVSLGQPFESAVETVADEVGFGPLQNDVDDLAFRLGLTTGSVGVETRREALGRFVRRVGTPLAEQTVGLVTGALAVGSDTETTFETLQTEIGSLYHQRKKLQSAMFVYVAVGWATALFVIGVVIAVDTYVLEAVVKLSIVSGATGVEAASGTVGTGRETRRFYLVTQATMLACGWFSGVASRGRYAALLHSSMLVVICYLCFVGIRTV